MTQPVTEIIAELQSSFAGTKTELATSLTGLFVDANQAAEALLSFVDEFGPAHALDRLSEDPSILGGLKDKAPGLAVAELTTPLSRAIDIQDRLDDLLKEADLNNSDRPHDVRTLDIQGEAFVVDGSGVTPQREHERHSLTADAAKNEDQRTFAQQLSEELDIPLAEPRSELDRSRDKER